ncbi:MAG: alpha/beta hydrolase [Candidatus Omnitrophica bacterium]|nr:alpha/beta hydrolase [Candidatus Omnitrophota bacterium]
MKIFLWAILSAVILLAGIRYIERHSIYFPMKAMFSTPEAAGMPYEEVYLKTSDGKRLHGWFIPNGKAAFTVVFCHGNAGNISHRIEKLSMLRDLGLSVFIFDYRGYGKSEGVPDEAGLYKDAAAAYEYVTGEKNVPADAVIVYGESIGGAVGIDLARKMPVKALITEEAFSSVKDMAAIAYPFLPHFIFSSRFDSLSKIKDVSCPKLIMHSIDDEIVPFSLGQKLFDAAAEPKKFLKLRGGHNTAFLDSKKDYTEGIRAFLKGL